MFDNGDGSSPRSANLSLSYHCEISSTTVTTSSIEPSVTNMTNKTTITTITSMTSITKTSITSMTSTNIKSTPSPSPTTCSTDGIWPETLQGHNVTGFYCYKGTVNGK